MAASLFPVLIGGVLIHYSRVVERNIVALSKADKAIEYVNYAKHCVKVARIIADRESRMAMREMAGEWMKLASQSAIDNEA
jgi:hypothetical protein